jgi:hypothetical protein
MKKYLLLLSCIVLSSWSVMAQKPSQTQPKKGTTTQKESPASTKVSKKTGDRNKEDLDTALARLSRKQAEIKELTKNLAYVQNKVTSLESELKDCNKKFAAECPPCATQGAIPTTGTIYKIQLGIFKNPDISDNFTSQKFLGIEKTDDKFRYMLNYFEDYEECMKFVNELKKLGIQGAYAVRYEDGKRVVYDQTPDSKPVVPAPAPIVTPNPTPAAPAIKPATKPATKPTTRPAAKPTTKPAAKTAAKPASKSALKPAPKPDTGEIAPVSQDTLIYR